MLELAAQIEAGALASALRRSRWVYPLVNAGHILGLALLIGAVVPMDLRVLAGREPGGLRGYAIAGLMLAVACGGLLFIVQSSEYLRSPWFLAKMGLIAAALVNAGLHLRASRRAHAALSLVLWIAVLVAGRMIAYG